MRLFTDKLDIKLIRLVKENPVLYDHNDTKYMDFNSREVAWQKIGDELKRPAQDCKVRWVNIRDVNRRMLRKSLSHPGIRNYKYQSELTFMRPYYRDVVIQQPKFESDGDDDNDNQEPDDDIPDNDEESDISDEPKMGSKPKRPSQKKKRKKKEIYENVKTEAVFTEPVTQTELDPSDPVDAFLLSIGPTLKSFSPYHLNLAKTKIFAVVQEHDLEQIVQRQRKDDQGTDGDQISGDGSGGWKMYRKDV